MIDRYTRPEMGQLWDHDHKFGKMLEVEFAVALAQADMGIIPRAAARQIVKSGRFSVKRILEIEKETKHDVIAFVSNVAENVGPHGRYIHYGLTSSDVLDTAMSLQVREAGNMLLKSMASLEAVLLSLSKKHQETLCPGRTHGMFAEPTTFGYKMAGFLAEHQRNLARLKNALAQMQICKLSGAVGTYSAMGMELEAKVARRLKLKPETIATQVVPRDRHAELFWSLSMIGTGLERLAVELRHLQRSEVSEVSEGFSRGQKGSSAMPHKKNPISSENVTGAARLLRGYLTAALENVALWHERDISHSSVERVIFPDAFILCDFAVDRMAHVLENLDVNKRQMQDNLDSSRGFLFSSHLLLALVDRGLSREEAYRHVQRLSHALEPQEHLRDKVLQDLDVKKYLKPKDVDAIFSGQRYKKNIKKVLSSKLKEMRPRA